ncbi:hypothetical protein H0I23_12330 [Cellulophaga sp. HaHaR_3_176]|uniref:hypothetical protein n=1 Tax=Cellulophaga sp. HaHaR_3_176 TaxID=1942464 RepID=UPI001C1FA605|nr:hypothetical protein [Cellulophaga sp. HaHaR_3_176]QWX83235.1 hypothetical protein H0I23_12330 [Cellulophaga sp. HaHaR_3_176]
MKIAAFILGVFLFCTSCSNDDEGTAIDSNLVGEWVLTDVVCFCVFPEDVDFNTHELSFSSQKNTVIVINNSDTNYLYESGEYDYVSTADAILFTIDNRSFTYQINDDELKLIYVDEPMIADDEVTYAYKRK